MLLNRVRCEAMEKIRVYFDRNLCRFLPPKESIFLICDTLLSFHNKNEATNLRIFNIIVAGDFFQAIICAFGT
ncbi:Uncharacterised protein [Shigella sonnei]|nr:hypothetical protein [Shigella sonnei]EFX9180082.1 hypothetical protein [Shigella sonnei]EFX9682516.1 hypothetical protein [Shigella sonnei]EGD9136721.1 hypothetical protein [Shigella sonnei]EGD9292116.1 hypothetical protein [Shigella sonnei]